ncbi:MAG: hypothetical protein M0R06_01440, partial [Sphaerochaeta sp.]|nr:hypothetical protein [Sphaerochaeta sp.]
MNMWDKCSICGKDAPEFMRSVCNGCYTEMEHDLVKAYATINYLETQLKEEQEAHKAVGELCNEFEDKLRKEREEY